MLLFAFGHLVTSLFLPSPLTEKSLVDQLLRRLFIADVLIGSLPVLPVSKLYHNKYVISPNSMWAESFERVCWRARMGMPPTAICELFGGFCGRKQSRGFESCGMSVCGVCWCIYILLVRSERREYVPFIALLECQSVNQQYTNYLILDDANLISTTTQELMWCLSLIDYSVLWIERRMRGRNGIDLFGKNWKRW
jgi:hypothetical protein